jgi:predicted O-methyltransferase YrrM
MIDIASGHPAIDRFLDDGYERVRGMSSRFAAAICGRLIARQTELGIAGDLVEIGTFEGRFFIATALGLATGEIAVGIDPFDWPNERLLDRFIANCAAAGLARDRFVAWKARSGAIAAEELRAKMPSGRARFVHIDGDHQDQALTADLELALAVLHPQGLIAIDDMLHPGYPELIVSVLNFLKRHPELVTLCIIDRENLPAAAKFVVCRAESVAQYETDLMQRFSRFHFTTGADVLDHFTLVLSPQLRDVDVGWDT